MTKRDDTLSRLEHYAIAAMQGILAAGTPFDATTRKCNGERMGMRMLAERAVEQALEVMAYVDSVQRRHLDNVNDVKDEQK